MTAVWLSTYKHVSQKICVDFSCVILDAALFDNIFPFRMVIYVLHVLSLHYLFDLCSIHSNVHTCNLFNYCSVQLLAQWPVSEYISNYAAITITRTVKWMNFIAVRHIILQCIIRDIQIYESTSTTLSKRTQEMKVLSNGHPPNICNWWWLACDICPNMHHCCHGQSPFKGSNRWCKCSVD